MLSVWNKYEVLFLVCVSCLWFSCKPESNTIPDVDDINRPYTIEYPAGFEPMSIPVGNELTTVRIALGKKLFFDKRLSRDSTVACASCHLQEHAFADFKPLSEGFQQRKGFRNAPSLANIGYHTSFFKDGGVPTLELQILAPIEEPREMNFSVPEVVARLENDIAIQQASQMAYGRAFDPFVLTRSIAAFERTFISGNSRFDQYYYQGKTNALNESEIRGMNLFYSNKTNCSQCHKGFDFTDYSFKNIGLYETYADSGRARISLKPEDRGKFKVPSLRNVAVTPPYMHNGSMATLEAVIEHFNSGGYNHPNKDALIKPLNLSAQEKTDLINFLKSLTDTNFLNNEAFKP